MSSQESTESLNECPMCLEELDLTDQSFKPCTCGYQMCRFCWHHIKENLNGRCPHCRKPYSEENYKFEPISVEEINKRRKEKKQKERERKKEEASNRKNLSNKRVVQRNLVYITNIPLTTAKEEILRKHEYFGQFGKIHKVVVNKNTIYNTEAPNGPSVSCYITYKSKDDAVKAIQAINGAWTEGRQLRASFGTTKYCTYFLRGVTCINPDCMYLHEKGEDKETFKEELILGKMNPQENTLVFPTPVKAPSKGNLLSNSGEGTIPVKIPKEEKETKIQIPPAPPALESKSAPWAGSIAKPSGSRKDLDPQEWPSALPKPGTSEPLTTTPPGEKERKSDQPDIISSDHKSNELKSALPPTASWASPSIKRNRLNGEPVAGSITNAGESKIFAIKQEDQNKNTEEEIEKDVSPSQTILKDDTPKKVEEEDEEEIPTEEPPEYEEQLDYDMEFHENYDHQEDEQKYDEEEILQIEESKKYELENRWQTVWENQKTESQSETWKDAQGLIELLLNENIATTTEPEDKEDLTKEASWMMEEQPRPRSRFDFAQENDTPSHNERIPDQSLGVPQESFWKSFLPHVNISFGRDSPEIAPTFEKKDVHTLPQSSQQPYISHQQTSFNPTESLYGWNQGHAFQVPKPAAPNAQWNPQQFEYTQSRSSILPNNSNQSNPWTQTTQLTTERVNKYISSPEGFYPPQAHFPPFSQFQEQPQQRPFHNNLSRDQGRFVDPAILGRGHPFGIEQNEESKHHFQTPWIAASSAYRPPNVSPQYVHLPHFQEQSLNHGAQKPVGPPPGLRTGSQQEVFVDYPPNSNFFEEDLSSENLLRKLMGESFTEETLHFESKESSSSENFPSDEDQENISAKQENSKKSKRKEKKKEKKKKDFGKVTVQSREVSQL